MNSVYVCLCSLIYFIRLDFLFQFSVHYLTKQLRTPSPLQLTGSELEKADTEKSEKKLPSLSSAGSSLYDVDTDSCLKLLVDVTSQLLSPSAQPKTPLMLMNECVKSVSITSIVYVVHEQDYWPNMLLELRSMLANLTNGFFASSKCTWSNVQDIKLSCKSLSICYMLVFISFPSFLNRYKLH